MFSLKVISFLGMGLVFMKPGNYKATICASSPFMRKYKQMNSFFLRTNQLAYLLAARCHWPALCTNRPHPLTKFHSCVAKGPAIHTHTFISTQLGTPSNNNSGDSVSLSQISTSFKVFPLHEKGAEVQLGFRTLSCWLCGIKVYYFTWAL